MNLSRSAGLRPSEFEAALEIEEELCAVVVVPCAGVDRAAAEADENRKVLDARPGIGTRTRRRSCTGRRLAGVVFAEQGLVAGGARSLR